MRIARRASNDVLNIVIIVIAYVLATWNPVPEVDWRIPAQLEHADTPPSRITQDEIAVYLDTEHRRVRTRRRSPRQLIPPEAYSGAACPVPVQYTV